VETLAIIVNYRIAALTVQAVCSVLDSDFLGSCRVVVVDNSEDPLEEKQLRSLLPREVTLLVPPENLGFGRACNLALKGFSGDYILLLNPDARILPGCLSRLQETLDKGNNVAAVGPQVFWDDGCNYYLPPPSPPFMFLFAPAMDGFSSSSWMKKMLNKVWRRHAVKIWGSEAPLTTGNLSGGHVLLKRKAVEHSGGLFDPRFFLYFEDTDLFMRLRQAGYALVFDTRARVVHHYDQTARHDTCLKRQWFVNSHDVFRQKHLTGEKSWLYAFLQRFSSVVGGGGGGGVRKKNHRFLALRSGLKYQCRCGTTGCLNGVPFLTLPLQLGCSAGENFWILMQHAGICWLRDAIMAAWAALGFGLVPSCDSLGKLVTIQPKQRNIKY